MGTFVLAAFVAVASVCLAFFWGFFESMAPAPKYDNIPNIIFFGGLVLAVVIASSHWWLH